jgi:hypothetical protein
MAWVGRTHDYPTFTLLRLPFLKRPTLHTVEACFQAAKAAMFGDGATRARILATLTPCSAKALGRKVQGFDEAR